MVEHMLKTCFTLSDRSIKRKGRIAVNSKDMLRYRLLLIGRAELLGILWGLIFGVVTWIVIGGYAIATEPADAAGVLVFLLWAPVPGMVGGAVGATIGVTAGAALALSGRRVLEQAARARLVVGGAAAAVPLAALMALHRPSPWVCLIGTGVAVVATVTGVLLTPHILHGPPPPAEWRRGVLPPVSASPSER